MFAAAFMLLYRSGNSVAVTILATRILTVLLNTYRKKQIISCSLRHGNIFILMKLFVRVWIVFAYNGLMKVWQHYPCNYCLISSQINPEDLKQSRVLIIPVGRPSQQQWLVHPQTELLLYTPDQLQRLSSAIPSCVLEKIFWPVSPMILAIWNSTKVDLLLTMSFSYWVNHLHFF